MSSIVITTPSLTINDTPDLIKDVMDTVKQAVVATMGPNGKLGIISIGTSVKVTKDGVTVAKAIQFDDPRKELVNKIITEAAIKTDKDCGDGTTTTVLYTAEYFELFTKYNSFREQRFIEHVANLIIAGLEKLAIKVELGDDRLFQLAMTSSNSDVELSKTVVDIYRGSNGKYPTVELKEGITLEDKVIHSDGLPIKMSYSDPSFSLNGNGTESTFTDFIPVVINDTLSDNPEVRNGLDLLLNAYKGVGTIVIIARSLEANLNSLLIRLNHTSLQGKPRVVAVNTNMGGSIGSLLMQDVAIMLGTQSFQSLEDAAQVKTTSVTSNLTIGNSRSVLSNLDEVTKEAISARADSIEHELGNYELGDRFSVRARFNEARIRNLRGELITVYVGGETNSEVKERLDRYEDVVKAVKSALVNGILPGVGSSMIKVGWGEVHEVLKDLINNPTHYPLNAREMLKDIANSCCSTYNYLMEQANVGVSPIEWYEGAYDHYPVCVSLSTGVTDTAEKLGIYDTALASITALKGGVQTAKILANGSSILLSNKIGAVSVIQK